jgi:hypothetical protein
MLAATDVPPPDTLKLPARVCLMGKRGLILAGLQVLLTSLTATAGPSEVALPAFSFTGRAPSPVLEVPAFSFVGRAFVPGVDVPAFTFVGRMPMPVVDVPPFSFAGRGGTSLVVAGKDKTLPVFGLAPRSVTTAPLVMTGRRPQNLALTTGALQMTGRRPQDSIISTGKLEMTGRRRVPGEFGSTPGFGQGKPGAQIPPEGQEGAKFGRPVFRLFRVVPLGGGAVSAYGGTNPFDIQDLRNDVGQALQVTLPTPVSSTPLTLVSALPSPNVKGSPATAQIEVNTSLQSLSWAYDGIGNVPTANSALTLSVVMLAPGNIQGRLDPVAPWRVVSSNYAQPFTTAVTTCTVLRAGSGAYYKINIGLSPAGVPTTGFQII